MRHQYWRSILVVLLALPVATSCVGEEPNGATSPAPSSATSPSQAAAPPDPPASWLAVHGSDSGFEVRRWEGDQSTSIGSWRDIGSESSSIHPTDVALGDGKRTAIIGTCCEPTAGTIFTADASSTDGALESSDQGFQVDAHVDGGLVARVDAQGNFEVRSSESGRAESYLVESAGAIDVAIAPDGRVVVLINPLRVSDPDPGPDPPMLLVLSWDGQVWAQEPIELNQDYCSVVGLVGGHVGLVQAPVNWNRGVEPCTGSSMETVSLDDGETSVVDLPVTARHLSADDSGMYLLATSTDGTVSWLTLDGRSGLLLENQDVLAADW